MTSLQMMDFIRQNKFKNENVALTISLMKYVSTITAELAMVWVILNPEDITEVVKDFIVLGFVIELDDLFATSSINA